MKALLARVTEDGYLLGCTDDFTHGWDDNYWADYYEESAQDLNIDTLEIEVPANMVDALLKHGTSEQVYSDGYDAWQKVLADGKVTD